MYDLISSSLSDVATTRWHLELKDHSISNIHFTELIEAHVHHSSHSAYYIIFQYQNCFNSLLDKPV